MSRSSANPEGEAGENRSHLGSCEHLEHSENEQRRLHGLCRHEQTPPTGGVAQTHEKGRGQWAEFPVLSFLSVSNAISPVSELPASPGEL